MKIQIRKYDPGTDYEDLFNLIHTEGKEWEEYISEKSGPKYRESLKNSVTYVALVDDILCGYSRSVNDSGLFVWILDLLVTKKYRGYGLGEKLMACVQNEFPDLEIYVLSDVDPYYEKLGYTKEGTIYRL